MTRSKGPVEEVSLPPTRMRKDVSTVNEGKDKAQGKVQANVQSQQRTADTPSPFARPGSWAGTSTTPTSEAGVQPAPSNPFARPDSCAGFAPPKPTSPHSSSSSPMSGHQFQEDVNTSVSWDLIDTDTDMEVANINSPSAYQTVTNKNCADSSKESQNNTVGLNHQLNTLYNQDFFVADTTGRRLSQIADKSSYPSLLPNGNAALQLRLPDLLLYLKMDMYLVDVKSGHHYTMYHNRIEKMSVLPKLYAAWPYRQLLQTIHDDAVRFGVNSPEPTTSKQSAPAIRPLSPIENAEPAQQEQQPSQCKPTIVRSLMTNAVNQGNANMTTITDALQRTTTQFVDALQQTIQMRVDAQAEENKNARLDKKFDKIKIFDGSNPAECHPWLEEVHALCTQMGRPFKEMLLLCAGQAVRDFIIDMALDATDEQIKNDLITGYSDLQGLGCKQAAYDNIAQRPDEPVRSYIVRYSRLFKLLNGTAPNEVRMHTTSMHFVNSLRSYLSSKVENRLLGMNKRNYSLGDTFTVALQCELKAIASERRHNKRNTITINNVNSEDQDHSQLEDTQEVHVRNPNYKGKNYDPNYQARKTEINKQQQQPTMTNNQYKAPYTRPAANNNNNLASSSDIAGEVTLKMTVDGYQLLKMNELIKNAAAWRARMPKTGRFDKYFDNKETTTTTPKVQINSATLQVMGQAAKDYGYTKDEFIEAVEMYEHFGNVNLEDVPAPSPQD